MELKKVLLEIETTITKQENYEIDLENEELIKVLKENEFMKEILEDELEMKYNYGVPQMIYEELDRVNRLDLIKKVDVWHNETKLYAWKNIKE